MSKQFFVRHGESQNNAGLSNHYNTELTDKGVEQVKSIALFLREQIGITNVFKGFCSPYTRCLQTAFIISKETGIPFSIVPTIAECPSEHNEKTLHIYRTPDHFPNADWSAFPAFIDLTGETKEHYQERLHLFLDLQLADKAIVVSHREPIRDMLEMLDLQKPDHLGNASITLVESKLTYVNLRL